MCCNRFENINYPFIGLDLVDIDDVDGRVLNRYDSPGTLLNEPMVEKYKSYMCRTYLKILTTYPLVVLCLVDIYDVDGCVLEHYDCPGTLLNEPLVIKYK